MIPGRFRGGPRAILANALLLLVLIIGTQVVSLRISEMEPSTWPTPWSGNIILAAAGLLFLGLAFLFPLHAGLLNLAIQGQFLAGFAAGSLVTHYASVLPGALVGLALVAGAAAGALVGALVAWLKKRFAIHEILSGLLLAAGLIPLARSVGVGPAAPPGITVEVGALAAPLAWAHDLKLPPHTVLTWGILLLTLGIVLSILAAHFLRASVKGFELRAVGSNPMAAVAAGVDVDGMQLLMMVLGGACAGLTGALQLWTEPGVALERWPFPLGFAGLTVAFLGAGYLRGALVAALILSVWLNIPGAPVVLGDSGWGAVVTLLLVLPALWSIPRLLPDQGAPRAIWRTRHREPL